MKHNRTSEAQISEAVLVILSQSPRGEATLSEIRRQIPKHIKLTSDDRAPSLTRIGEELWEQIVRNITSHKTTSGNIIAEGLATNPRKGRLRITDSGLAHVRSRMAS